MTFVSQLHFTIPSKNLSKVKKLVIALLVLSSMGFAVASDYKSIHQPKPQDTITVAQSYGYLEVSSPSANSITLSVSGN